MSFMWPSVCVDVQIHYQALIKMKGVRWRMKELSFSGASPVSDKCSSIYTIRVLSLPLLSLFPSSCFFSPALHFPDHLISALPRSSPWAFVGPWIASSNYCPSLLLCSPLLEPPLLTSPLFISFLLRFLFLLFPWASLKFVKKKCWFTSLLWVKGEWQTPIAHVRLLKYKAAARSTCLILKTAKRKNPLSIDEIV